MENLYDFEKKLNQSIAYLNEALKNGVVHLKFVKKDGTIREMKATLKVDLLPKRADNANIIYTTEEYKSSLNQVVYDLDKKQFRSFTKDKLVEWKIEV